MYNPEKCLRFTCRKYKNFYLINCIVSSFIMQFMCGLSKTKRNLNWNIKMELNFYTKILVNTIIYFLLSTS